jgi:hypothetical protein
MVKYECCYDASYVKNYSKRVLNFESEVVMDCAGSGAGMTSDKNDSWAVITPVNCAVF